MTEENQWDVEEVEARLREKDLKVLKLISEGEDDVQYITSASNLNNSKVNHCFNKLEDKDLITVRKPDGFVTRVINGTKQVFQAPKQARLTELGEQVVESTVDEEVGQQYEDLTRDELVRKVHELEEEIEEMRNTFKVFRKQVQDRLNS